MSRWGSALLAVLWMVAGGAQAQSASDYARVVVPDVAGATAFLDGVMGCDPLDRGASRALLACGHGSMVEVVRGDPSAGTPALRLRVEDVGAAAAWLKERHVSADDDRAGPADGIHRVEVRTYSPSIRRYLHDPGNEFVLRGVDLG